MSNGGEMLVHPSVHKLRRRMHIPGHFGGLWPEFWPHFGGLWPEFWPFLAYFGPILGLLGLDLGHFGPILGLLGLHFGHFRPIFG